MESQIKNECSEKEYNHILFGEKVDMKFMYLKWNITTITWQLLHVFDKNRGRSYKYKKGEGSFLKCLWFVEWL